MCTCTTHKLGIYLKRTIPNNNNKIPFPLTFTSLKLKMSAVVNVEFPSDGLFLTLGNMMPPFRDVCLFELTLNAFVGIVFDWTVFCELLVVDVDVDDDDDDDCDDDDCV